MSVHKTIADAVKTKIETLTGEPTVVIRDRQMKLEEDTLPLTLVVMGGERSGDHYFGGEYRGYEIFISVFYAQNHNVQTNIDDARNWREDIRNLFILSDTVQPPILTGVSSVWDCDEIESPAQRPAAAEVNYEESRLGLLFWTSEA